MTAETGPRDDSILETTLRKAAADLHQQDFGGTPPPFVPNRNPAPLLAAAAAVLLIVGGLFSWLLLRDDPAGQSVVTAETPEPSPVPDESTQPDPTAVPGPTAPSNEPETRTAPSPDFSVLTTGQQQETLEPASRPGVGQPFTDPAFGTTITRITNAPEGGAIVPLAAATSAWNADESLLLLYRQGSGHQLHDGTSGEFLRELDFGQLESGPADIEELYWSWVDPNVLYFVDANTLVSFDVTTDTATALHTFAGCDRVHSEGPVAPSTDDSLWGLICVSGDGEQAMSYSTSTGVETRTPIVNGAPVPDRLGTQMAASTGQLLDPLLSTVVGSIGPLDATNVSFVLDAAGAQTAVGPAFAGPSGSLVLSTPDGQAEVVIGEATGYPPPPSGTFVAVGGPQQPSLVALSIVGDATVGSTTLLDGEILLVDTSTSPAQVARIGHHRSSAASYFASPFISISPSGTRVLFASDWGIGPVDTWMIQLPVA